MLPLTESENQMTCPKRERERETEKYFFDLNIFKKLIIKMYLVLDSVNDGEFLNFDQVKLWGVRVGMDTIIFLKV